MQPYLYDVYTKDGSLIISEMTSRQIADALGIRKNAIPDYARNRRIYNDQYIFVVSGNEVIAEKKENSGMTEKLMEEWESVRSLFKNVIWVNKYEPGVKKLR